MPPPPRHHKSLKNMGVDKWAADRDTTDAKLLDGRVKKLRRLYWFGMGFVALHAAPAMLIGGYAMAKSNEYDGVLCMEIGPDGGFVLDTAYDPEAVYSNMHSVGFWWTGGAFFLLFFVYTALVWFERLQQVCRQPKRKGKAVAAFREFGTHGTFCACCLFSSGVACYVLFVLQMLLLSTSVLSASEACSTDEGMGGQMYSAATFVNGMAWLFSIVTAAEVVLLCMWGTLTKKRKKTPVLPTGPESDAGTDPSSPDPSVSEAMETQSVDADGEAASAALAVRSAGGRGSSSRLPAIEGP